MKYIFSAIFTGLLLFGVTNFASASTGPLSVDIRDSSGMIESSFNLTLANPAGGVSITATDLGVDGVPEIVLGNGFGNEPRVWLLRQDGSVINDFLAYASNFGRGITVAACDLDQDGYSEIVTGTQYGGGPQVRVFDVYGNLKFNPGFFAYAENFRGGVNVGCADIDNDGTNEIITTPGPTGGPHVRIWNLEKKEWKIDYEFFAFDATDNTGVALAIKKESGKNYLQLSHQSGISSEVVTYEISSKAKIISIFDKNNESSVTTSTLTVDNQTQIIVAPKLKNYNVVTENETLIETSHPLNIATVDLDQDGNDEIISVRSGSLLGPSDEKQIIVDLSEQRLYAYNYGLLDQSFLISSGTGWFPTPQGNYEVLAKKEYVDYTWSFGENSSENYSMGLTPWNVMFKPHYYIHSAPWHNNFGNPMSHGCVNASTENAEWIYHWSELGVPVEIVE